MSTERNQLLEQIRSKKRAESLHALEIIKERGWLTDGTLQGASLYGVKWQHTDLRNADLRGCTLSGIVLQGADISGADFTGAEMIDSDLRGVKAHGTTLVGVDAIACKTTLGDFTDADLSGATFGNATFSFTKLHHTTLTDVDFNNAIFDNTILADVDLSSARNLQSVRHYGPSDVGVATLVRSVAVEMDFWRGCGVAEPTLMMLTEMRKPALFYPVYIAYAHPDRMFARAVQEGLRAVGVRCWLHEHQLEEHVDFYRALNLGARSQDRVLVVCSPASINSWWIAGQVTLAQHRAQQHRQDEPPAMMVLEVKDTTAADATDVVVRDKLRAYPSVDFNALEDQTAFMVQLEAVVQMLRRF